MKNESNTDPKDFVTSTEAVEMTRQSASNFETLKTVAENKSKHVNAGHRIRAFLLFANQHAFLLIFMLCSLPFNHNSIINQVKHALHFAFLLIFFSSSTPFSHTLPIKSKQAHPPSVHQRAFLCKCRVAFRALRK